MAAQRKPVTPVDHASSAPTQVSPPQLRILKKGTCPTVSGKSELTYHVGCHPNGSIHIRVSENSGGGFFNQTWIALADILRLLKPGAPVTAVQLAPLYKHASANSPGFLAAVLKAEGLLQAVEGKQRVHQLGDTAAFQARVSKLVGSTVSLPDDLATTKAKAPSKAGPTAKAPAKATSTAPAKGKATASKPAAKAKSTAKPKANAPKRR